MFINISFEIHTHTLLYKTIQLHLNACLNIFKIILLIKQNFKRKDFKRNERLN
jgi:hypothetical protein